MHFTAALVFTNEPCTVQQMQDTWCQEFQMGCVGAHPNFAALVQLTSLLVFDELQQITCLPAPLTTIMSSCGDMTGAVA